MNAICDLSPKHLPAYNTTGLGCLGVGLRVDDATFPGNRQRLRQRLGMPS